MEIPEEVLFYHGERNRLSKWMYARGLFSLAATVRKLHNGSFDSIDRMREFIAQAIREYRILQGYGVVARFDPDTYDNYIGFARIGNGSLGGKARGLAFMNSMLHKYRFYDKYEGVRIYLPRTLVIATDWFRRVHPRERPAIRDQLRYLRRRDTFRIRQLAAARVAGSTTCESSSATRRNRWPCGRVRNWRTRTTSLLPVSIRLI